MRIKPKKRLGQNFLVDKNIQDKIIEACKFLPSDIVFEIGSGRGELTRLIAKRVKFHYALEIDASLCEALEKELGPYANVKIINKDVLDFDLNKFFSRTKNKIKVFGNIPYYITSPIVTLLIESRDKINEIFITVQEEFAKRMCAASGSKSYGAFSCYAQYYLEPKIVLKIKKTCFFPKPKVDSCLVRLLVRQSSPVSVRDESRFFKIIRTSFNQRRKTLRNSLADLLSSAKLEEFFEKNGIDRNIRPEDLSLSDFAALSNL